MQFLLKTIIKKFIFFLIPVLFFLIQSAKAQPSINDSLLRVSDSIIVSWAGPEYFSLLKRDSQLLKDESIIISGIKDHNTPQDTTVTYSVTYWLNETNFENFLAIIDEKGRKGILNFSIEYNNKYELLDEEKNLKESQVKSQVKAYQRSLSAILIAKDKAMHKADAYFTKVIKGRSWTPSRVYDMRNDMIYWCVTKENGFKKVTKESIYINAENGDYIFKETYTYHQPFWQGLFYW